MTILVSISLLLSFRGKTQKGLLLFASCSITLTYIVVYLNNIQTPAPYVALGISLAGLFFIKKHLYKWLIFIYGFGSYTGLNYYQLTTKNFDTQEYVISILFFLFLARGLKYVDAMRNKYELRVIDQNIELQHQNLIIKEKTNQLIDLEKEKHEKEFLLQQKDLEMVLSTNAIQIQLKENIIERLKNAQKTSVLEEEVSTIILELYQQNEIQKKMKLHQGEVSNLNTVFFERLQELHPKVTRTEREFCNYIKLGMTSKEIALTRNTSTNTVNVAKTRLRKKLDLATNQDIAAYLLSI